MSKEIKVEEMAKELDEKLIPYLSWQSADVKDDYEACEYVAAADAAIHDLGAVRADLPEQLLSQIELLIDAIRNENDEWNIRFVDHMEKGYKQLKERFDLTSGKKP
ncbi:MAG: hypothetical protein LBN12_00630, partial [Clostridiales Family XIII bacterium]|nr:hypothetical protein [Clostridiales Family XIII bacterium]